MESFVKGDSALTARYDLEDYKERFILPSGLIEISGLSYYAEKGLIAAVNDESAIIYFINPKTGEVESEKKFGFPGDYEGIEIVGSIAYVVKSNGNLYLYSLEEEKAIKIVKTPLSSSNDVEGLGYSPKENALILSCKGEALIQTPSKKKDKKGIFMIPLDNENLDIVPHYLLYDRDLKSFVRKKYSKADISEKKKDKYEERMKKFSPSGIAVHPISGHFYILSSQGKTLVIVDDEGGIVDVIMLDNDVHRQPEGICFSPNGDLYISNEGDGMSGRLYKFIGM
jgi:uncharacterized protein YjiK